MSREAAMKHPSSASRATSLTLLGLSMAICVFHACSTAKPSATPAPPPAAQAPRIVKGDLPSTSELALLMRAMATFADSTRKKLASGEDLLPYPVQFQDLKTATATPGMKDPNTFDPLANAWLHQLKALYESAPPDRVAIYNGLVQTCAGCHATMCPGPLVRIKKLRMPDKLD